jgi:hypothetical protein
MINLGNILLMLAAVACIIVGAYAAPTSRVVVPAGMDLSLDSMQIADPEHTTEYLEKTGNTAQPGLQAHGRNLAGNWSFELRDQKSMPMGDIELRLYQSEAALFGKGVFKQDLNQQIATVEGSLMEGSAMILNVVSLGNVYLYRMTLDSADGNSTSGSFILYMPTGEAPMKGSIFGGKSDSRKIS